MIKRAILMAILSVGSSTAAFAVPKAAVPALKPGAPIGAKAPATSTPANAPAAAPDKAPGTASATPAAPAQPQLAAAGLSPEAQRLLTAQVLLDRAHFSPGAIDATDGSNMREVADAYRAAHKIAAGGDIVAPLVAADNAPVLARYTITADDVAGPFVEVPKDFGEMAKLKTLGYASPLEALGERFHADPALLKRLNANADFARAGQEITVPAIETAKLPGTVATIEVDKTHQQVRAFSADGTLEAVYPATVGSTERPAPEGTWKVVSVAPHPTYTYDPKRLTFGKKSLGKLTIAAGPNNPVGATWIALSKATYGIHGTPDPELVGKRASHGCVRLTNWDAIELGKAVKAGTKVVFVGQEQRG